MKPEEPAPTSPAADRSVQTPGHRDTVAVVVTAYNHARYLASAIDSVLSQSRPADEIIVVDDGSTDDPSSVVARYRNVRFIRQANAGPSAARNTGLQASTSDAVVFLDSDDRLLPTALEHGLRCLARAADAGFVCGGHQYVDENFVPIGRPIAMPTLMHYAGLLVINRVGMHAAVMYRREKLVAVGAFDRQVRMCEDYDVLLRMAHRFPAATHSGVVAEYRQHPANTSKNARAMLYWALRVHEKQRSIAEADPRLAVAWQAGRKAWNDFYQPQIPSVVRRAKRGLRRVLPRPALRLAYSLRSSTPPPPGFVSFGSFAGTEPLCDHFGYGRGTPVDRYYIENFLERQRGCVAGAVLEVGDDAYSRRYGGSRITRQDVLHVADVPEATIVGDLSSPGILPADTYDCIVLTQTLHLVYDMKAAVDEIFRGLKPGGVLLLTTPGISRIDRAEWGGNWLWSLTAASAARLFGERFGAGQIEVETFGNVHVATAFLQGMAFEELDRGKLDFVDPCFPVTITVRAVKGLAP